MSRTSGLLHRSLGRRVRAVRENLSLYYLYRWPTHDPAAQHGVHTVWLRMQRRTPAGSDLYGGLAVICMYAYRRVTHRPGAGWRT